MAHPELKCKINRIYNSSFPGSVLWDLTATLTAQIVNSWSVSVRHMWGLPMDSHRSFVESLGGTHAKVMLMSRYISFIKSVKKSSRRAVLLLFERVKSNLMTVTGRNIRVIEEQAENTPICEIKVEQFKKNVKFHEAHESDQWKVSFVKEIVNVKQNKLKLEPDDDQSFSVEELDEIMTYIVTS